MALSFVSYLPVGVAVAYVASRVVVAGSVACSM
jgi:hypothetical protein